MIGRPKFVLASGFLSETAQARVKAFNVSILSKPYDMSDASKVVMQKLAENGEARPA